MLRVRFIHDAGNNERTFVRKFEIEVLIERTMLRWFYHVERMNVGILTAQICRTNVNGGVGRGRPRWYILVSIG